MSWVLGLQAISLVDRVSIRRVVTLVDGVIGLGIIPIIGSVSGVCDVLAITAAEKGGRAFVLNLEAFRACWSNRFYYV